MKLGCIADDITGATDAAALIARSGARVVQWIGQPDAEAAASAFDDADAIVIALKIRSVPAQEAIAAALAARAWLAEAGAARHYYKYCSTFDSTPAGNIGPIAQALAAGSNAPVPFCPAFPENGRTQYAGHLFVHGLLLNESGMERHPLNPMTDADLVRVLAAQLDGAGAGLVRLEAVRAGADAVRAALAATERFALVDAIDQSDLDTIAEVVADLPLVTGGSALAGAIAARLMPTAAQAASASPMGRRGPVAILAGSCSIATRGQIAAAPADWPRFVLPEVVDPAFIATIARQAAAQGVVLIHSPDAREDSTGAAERIERGFAVLARGLADAGLRDFIVAGGETSGAVSAALGLRAIAIGTEIAPGVPWTTGLDAPHIRMAAKSGNFGGPDFFAEAITALGVAA